MAAAGVRGVVVTYACAERDAHSHESITRDGIARRIAALMGFDFAGEYEPARRYPGAVYFVPSDTLIGAAHAAALGIRGARDLFGAVVPHPFVATKSITHPLVDAQARAPEGWSAAFAEAMRPHVLNGHTAFHRRDAARAALDLLARGAVRIKRATGIGGVGQFVVHGADELRDVLDRFEDAELARFGVVVEENLHDVRTYSVGRVEVAGIVATYCGTQCLTGNNHGALVYGGSDLLFARGDFEALLVRDLGPELRLAIDHARRYDAAAQAHFPAFVASRRNYDVAEGLDTRGARRMGVLEQSWRIGGASGAEVAALEGFRADPALPALRARCVERYGNGVTTPAEATVYYRDVDARVGMLTKYTIVEPHADAR